MSLFSASLESVIRAHGWNQTTAATHFGLSISAVSNYLSGRRPAIEQLARICEPLEDFERSALLAAHLRDELPSNYRDLVSVAEVAQSSILREEALAAWQTAKLPPATRSALDHIAREATHSEPVRDWIIASADLLRQ